jgi:hypothetical protein
VFIIERHIFKIVASDNTHTIQVCGRGRQKGHRDLGRSDYKAH